MKAELQRKCRRKKVKEERKLQQTVFLPRD